LVFTLWLGSCGADTIFPVAKVDILVCASLNYAQAVTSILLEAAKRARR
jgi:hypothetical protein